MPEHDPPPPHVPAPPAAQSGAARRTNRLAREKSPYLFRHASNPVDWFPWGEEAFAKARAEGRPEYAATARGTRVLDERQ
jgi:hypothetical protein